MLQNLANKPSYSKEAYMATLNPFVENNKARINQFLNNLCEVGDFYDTLEVQSSPPRQSNAHPTSSDGPVYGSLQEGHDDPHHVKRIVQHPLLDLATYRGSRTFSPLSSRCRITHRFLVTKRQATPSYFDGRARSSASPGSPKGEQDDRT